MGVTRSGHSADFYIRMAIEVRNLVAGCLRDLSRFGHLLISFARIGN